MSVDRRRLAMWRHDPKCYWCGCETVLPDNANRVPRNMATIDHLYPRHHPERHSQHHEVVLACYNCNESRNRKDWKERTPEDRRALAEAMRHAREVRREQQERETARKPYIRVWRSVVDV